MEKINIGIIGAGQIARTHLDMYNQIEGANVVAICDINEAAAQQAAEKYGIAHVTTDFRKLLERDDVEAVDVCLHNNFHSTVSIAAMQAGKHVYCEKPIAGTYTDGKAMLQAAEETGKLLHIQLGTLYQTETKAAKSLIDSGQLGRIYHARSTGYRRRNRPYIDGYGTPAFTRKDTAGGGALLDMGVYHISQILYLMGLPQVERVKGMLYQEVEVDALRRETSGFDVEELALGFVSFKDGVSMDIVESWAVHMNEFEGSSIFGSKGGLRVPQAGSKTTFSFHTAIGDMDMDCTTDLNRLNRRWHLLRDNEDAYDSSQHHWIAALQGRVELLPTAELALLTMLISEGMYLSAEWGREVTVEEIEQASKSKAIPL